MFSGTESSEKDLLKVSSSIFYILFSRPFPGRYHEPALALALLSDLSAVRRSSNPIDLDVEDALGDKSQRDKKKPVLEIVTTVPTSIVNKSHRVRRRGWRYDNVSVDSDGESEVQVPKSENTVMVIRSTHLANALTAVVSYFPGISFTGDEVKIEAPYSALLHHCADLEQYKTSQPEAHDEEYASTTAKHIDILLGFLEQTYGQQIREEEERHIRKTPTATFDWLWLLLQPGTVIYTLFDSTWTPFAISRVTKKEVSNTDGLHSYSSEYQPGFSHSRPSLSLYIQIPVELKKGREKYIADSGLYSRLLELHVPRREAEAQDAHV